MLQVSYQDVLDLAEMKMEGEMKERYLDGMAHLAQLGQMFGFSTFRQLTDEIVVRMSKLDHAHHMAHQLQHMVEMDPVSVIDAMPLSEEAKQAIRDRFDGGPQIAGEGGGGSYL